MRASIVIASYGSDRWRHLGDTRALPSAESQGAHEVIRVHQPDGRVATARNAGAEQATGDWLIFLDADDELAPGYVGAMQRALEQQASASSLLAPATSYRRNGRAKPAMFWPECSPESGNWLVIGTAVSRALWQEVGGFDDRADYGAYEDWAFWIKCQKAGAKIVRVPDAIYIAHVTSYSRHRGHSRQEALGWHYAVGHEHYPDLYPESWLRRPARGARQRRRVR